MFARLATDLTIKPVGGFDSWRDGTDLIELIVNFRNGYYNEFPFERDILNALEDGVITMLDNGVGSDDLERISDAIIHSEETLGPDIAGAVREAVRREFDEIDQTVANIDSESALEEQKTTLEKLALRAHITDAALASAIDTVNTRILALGEVVEEADAPSFSGAITKETDEFDDRALMNLFVPLLNSLCGAAVIYDGQRILPT